MGVGPLAKAWKSIRALEDFEVTIATSSPRGSRKGYSQVSTELVPDPELLYHCCFLELPLLQGIAPSSPQPWAISPQHQPHLLGLAANQVTVPLSSQLPPTPSWLYRLSERGGAQQAGETNGEVRGWKQTGSHRQ